MKIRIIVPGKITGFVKDGVEHYKRLLRRFADVELISIPREGDIKKRKKDIIIRKEAERIKRYLREKAFLLLLDVRGKELSSEDFSDLLKDILESGKNLDIVIGGPFGIDDSIRKKADFLLSLSRMTLTHELCIIVILEQMFRAFKILKGETYHY